MKSGIWLIGVALLLGAFLFYADKKEKRHIRMIEAQNARSISTLPAGVEEAWIAYIKKRFSEEIQREGNNLKVRTSYMGVPPTYSYIPLNYPYEIDCNGFDMGISIYFGAGDDQVTSASLTGLFSLDQKNEPERGVPVRSVASNKLGLALCALTASMMDSITQPTFNRRF